MHVVLPFTHTAPDPLIGLLRHDSDYIALDERFFGDDWEAYDHLMVRKLIVNCDTRWGIV